MILGPSITRQQTQKVLVGEVRGREWCGMREGGNAPDNRVYTTSRVDYVMAIHNGCVNSSPVPTCTGVVKDSYQGDTSDDESKGKTEKGARNLPGGASRGTGTLIRSRNGGVCTHFLNYEMFTSIDPWDRGVGTIGLLFVLCFISFLCGGYFPAKYFVLACLFGSV